jgi:cAMP and cAMP-inhibited cGMP 3',5'-cyclic phosphodiesterase 10
LQKFAKVTLNAERGTFFIIDRDSEDLIADLFDEGDEENKEGAPQYKKAQKVRFAKERGIAGLVARTGITVNVKDAYKDTRFNKEIDQKTGFITRSILCMPIMGVEGILGVVQVVNKKSGGSFSSTDEILFKTFSVYCALALRYTKVTKQLHNTVTKRRLYSTRFIFSFLETTEQLLFENVAPPTESLRPRHRELFTQHSSDHSFRI